MAKQDGRPEEDWNEASLDQIADLRAWVLARGEVSDADGITGWLLSRATDRPERPSRHQRQYYRRVLNRYGPPRKIAGPVPSDAQLAGTDTETAASATATTDGVIRFRRVGATGQAEHGAQGEHGPSGSRAGSR